MDNPINTGLAAVAAVTSIVSVVLAYREYRRTERGVMGENRQVVYFLSREAMVPYIVGLYKRAGAGDEIWGQCVGCANYSADVSARVLDAAGRGATFKIIVNKFAPSAAQIRKIFDPIESADVVEGKDNAIRIEGLSDREVLIGLPGMTSFTGILVRDQCFVSILREWHARRFMEIKSAEAADDLRVT